LRIWLRFFLVTPLLIQVALAGDAGYSPYVGRDFPDRVFWGDTHLHTSLSLDAAAYGSRLGPDEAYRFARGERVTSSSGQAVRLSRPLDFLVAADHSDGLGVFTRLRDGDPALIGAPVGRRWHEMLQAGKNLAVTQEMIAGFAQGDLPWRMDTPELMGPVWQQVVDAAERHNDPGTFTAFIGYEWTALARGNNLHRVVIYRDGADKLRDRLPATAAASIDPEDLWRDLSDYEGDTGGRVLAIPHNGNLSNGMMFSDTTLAGEPLDRDYRQRRRRWEPLYEITQIKGDGETHPLLSPDDEFADYEIWDHGNLDFSEAKRDDMLRYEYAREALKRGISYRALDGVNPFEFGVIGSTDSHTALATAQENNFFGKHPVFEPGPERLSAVYRRTDHGTIMAWRQVASGYAAVWARENTREALWDALQRREVYGTTGSRITLRFFGGWDFRDGDAARPDLAAYGYASGVPMGGVLHEREQREAPGFLLAAQRDPIGANLDRIQVVKGWTAGDGNPRERVYDVAWGDDRRPGPDGRLPPVGNTVDSATATWTNTIGSPSIAGVWRDPDFDPSVPAFYYLRVLEIPTPRWTTYDAVRFGRELPDEVSPITRERAYSSPIWYYPE
jgi:hypothetical protein